MRMNVKIERIKLTDHALFTREDVLCRQLEENFEEYKRREIVNLVCNVLITLGYSIHVYSTREDVLCRQLEENFRGVQTKGDC